MTRTRQRPDIPAGYGVSTDGDGMLEWDRVARAITDAEIYWLSTVTVDAPHLVPLHATALDGVVYLSGDDDTRWARNLARDGRIHIGLEHDGLQVMVRGTATHTTPAGPEFSAVNASLDGKYGFSFDDPFPMWVVPPDRVIAFDPDKFATSPTQFTFGDAP